MKIRIQTAIQSALAAAAVVAMQPSAAAAADVTVAAFGGVWEESLRKCVISPFEAETGKTVDVVLGAPVQWMNQIAASPDDPPFDVIYMPSDNAYDVVSRGLAEKFTLDKVPNMAELVPKFAEIGDGYGVVHNYGAMGIIYNKETVTEPPADWKEFIAGVSEGKWYAAIPSVNYPGALSTVLWHFADLYGGGVDNIEPGLEKMKEMQAGGTLSFWSDPNQVLNGLRSGELDIAMYWDGRAWSFIDDGNDQFTYINPAPGSVAAMTWILKVKNGDELGWKFINTALSAKAQGCFASAIRYGVANKNAEFDPAVAPQITKFDELVFPPFVEINKLTGEWIETWNKEIGR